MEWIAKLPLLHHQKKKMMIKRHHHVQRPQETVKLVLSGLMPYLDDYIVNARDPFAEDLVWSMDDSRHTESTSKELHGD